jgi:hypothetical protein
MTCFTATDSKITAGIKFRRRTIDFCTDRLMLSSALQTDVSAARRSWYGSTMVKHCALERYDGKDCAMPPPASAILDDGALVMIESSWAPLPWEYEFEWVARFEGPGKLIYRWPARGKYLVVLPTGASVTFRQVAYVQPAFTITFDGTEAIHKVHQLFKPCNNRLRAIPPSQKISSQPA